MLWFGGEEDDGEEENTRKEGRELHRLLAPRILAHFFNYRFACAFSSLLLRPALNPFSFHFHIFLLAYPPSHPQPPALSEVLRRSSFKFNQHTLPGQSLDEETFKFMRQVVSTQKLKSVILVFPAMVLVWWEDACPVFLVPVCSHLQLPPSSCSLLLPLCNIDMLCSCGCWLGCAIPCFVNILYGSVGLGDVGFKVDIGCTVWV